MSNQPGIELKRSKYRLLGLVGQGQFGRVFCAVHRQTGRLVALKNLEQQRFPTHRFLRELRFLLSLHHPNIVTCRALEHTATGRYLVMDYCEGGTLRHLMSEEGRLSLPQSLNLVADILAGLEHAHSRGIVHCDIKPENILLNLQPTGWTARISDFGIARLSQELAALGMGTGSPAYMAPEQFYGQYSPASDLYSVGIILFELITGDRPFSGTPFELMSAHLNCSVPLNAIPDIWRPLVLTALQKLVARRFHSATEMLSTLRSITAISDSGDCLSARSIAFASVQPRTVPVRPFRVEWQAPLQRQVQCLAVAQVGGAKFADSDQGMCLFRAEGTQLVVTSHSPTGSQTQARSIAFPTLIRAILPRPQGCFAIGQDAVYRIPAADEVNLHPVRILEHTSEVAIEPGGRWVAYTATDSAGISRLMCQALPPFESTVAVAPQPIQLTASPDFALQQVIALNSRYVAVILTRTNGTETWLEILSRRGHRVGSLVLPIALKQAIATPTPYRLLAVDPNNCQSLLIDLKPFRIRPVAVGILPQFLTASPWGYSITDIEGRIIFLDAFGQQLSQIEGLVHATAITPADPHRLLVAHWNIDRGSFYTLDLKALDVGLLL